MQGQRRDRMPAVEAETPKKRSVVVGVGGGIAAYKAAELCRALVQRDFSVQVVMTAAAQEFVRPLTFAALTGRKVEPGEGFLACGMEGPGRLAEPEEIAQAVAAELNRRRDLEGETVLITAGPTQEPLDPVRFISNRSSGKMGYAMAAAAVERGARVTLISG